MKNKFESVHFNIKENSWIARLAAWKLSIVSIAIVLGNTIHLYHINKEEFLQNTTWLKHEICHIKQFEEHGFLPFIFKYIWESLQNGYYNNKYEVAARHAENTL